MEVALLGALGTSSGCFGAAMSAGSVVSKYLQMIRSDDDDHDPDDE